MTYAIVLASAGRTLKVLWGHQSVTPPYATASPSLTPSYPSPQHVCVQWAKFCFGKLLVQNEIYSNAKRIRNLPGMPNKLQYKFQISWDCRTLKGSWLAHCVAYYNIFLIK